jgi:uncharacterized protein YaeQ
MALSSTIYHFRIDLSDVDRNVYESLDLRVARHPSETLRYLLTRTLAYCLLYQEGISFSKGLSFTDEPAVWVRHGDGRVALWIDIGHPSTERIHKANKASDRVVIVTHLPIETLRDEALQGRVHKGETVEVLIVDVSFLDALEQHTNRNVSFSLTRSEDQLYVTIDGHTLEATVGAHRLLPTAS